MNRPSSTYYWQICCRHDVRRRSLRYIGLVVLMSLVAANAFAVEIDGFTEPYRSVNVASAEIGIISQLLVEEGETVEKGQPLAALNSELQQSLLSIAEKQMNSKGRIESARAEVELKQQRVKKLEALAARGHAHDDEVERARTDLAIAEAQLLSAQEDQIVRQLEYERIAVQLKQRSIVAPIHGVVTRLHKQAGEFVAPSDPEILSLVQLDRLIAIFSLPSPLGAELQTGDLVPVQIGSAAAVDGVIEFVSPVTDAESDTVRVKVALDNPEGRLRSGQRCSLQLAKSTRRNPVAHGTRNRTQTSTTSRLDTELSSIAPTQTPRKQPWK